MKPTPNAVRRGCPGCWGEPLAPNASPLPVAFFDRDGVLNEDFGYVSQSANWTWRPGAREALALVRDAGWWIVVVTNQSGVGRGYYTEDDFLHLTSWMLSQEPMDLVLYCPHSPDENCPARKPGVAMLEAACHLLPIDLAGSFLVGDKDTDLMAAENFGIHGISSHEGRLDDLVRAQLERNRLTS